MHQLITDLYPICRSITGDGVRQTLAYLQRHLPLQIREVPSGTPAFDWTVPQEWNISDAWIKNSRGERVVDFRQSNLHVLNYSTPIRRKLSLTELRPHLFSLPEQPDRIPYRTSYYQANWGFCLPHRQLLELEEGEYEVCIDSTLEPGHLSYGELFLPGAADEEVLISCHICHPSLANDNLSGIAVAAMLAQHLGQQERRYGYRFLFIPGTIGAIVWLSRNQATAQRIKHGLVLTCVGDPSPFTYKKSRRGNATIDRAVACVLGQGGYAHQLEEFTPYGYDERQFCSPGFNLPVGCLMRAVHGRFAEYHTSADNLAFVQPAALTETLKLLTEVCGLLEADQRYVNTNPNCEPQLGKRGLYRPIGGQMDAKGYQMALLWMLNMSDGEHSLLDIAERSGLPWATLAAATTALREVGLLVPREEEHSA
ncbi:MAG: DUF4910 domain-containing protein [Chloroflexaceae bacterium]|jgi:aminopeptidase-like protein|nr:DUF4910 domain-containing protein [Chloroflexaceae bacterium]